VWLGQRANLGYGHIVFAQENSFPHFEMFEVAREMRFGLMDIELNHGLFMT
jgi:hypothetical protein